MDVVIRSAQADGAARCSRNFNFYITARVSAFTAEREFLTVILPPELSASTGPSLPLIVILPPLVIATDFTGNVTYVYAFYVSIGHYIAVDLLDIDTSA